MDFNHIDQLVEQRLRAMGGVENPGWSVSSYGPQDLNHAIDELFRHWTRLAFTQIKEEIEPNVFDSAIAAIKSKFNWINSRTKIAAHRSLGSEILSDGKFGEVHFTENGDLKIFDIPLSFEAALDENELVILQPGWFSYTGHRSSRFHFLSPMMDRLGSYRIQHNEPIELEQKLSNATQIKINPDAIVRFQIRSQS